MRRSNVGHGRPQYVYQPPAERPIEPDGRVTPELFLKSPTLESSISFAFLTRRLLAFARTLRQETVSPARQPVRVQTGQG